MLTYELRLGNRSAETFSQGKPNTAKFKNIHHNLNYFKLLQMPEMGLKRTDVSSSNAGKEPHFYLHSIILLGICVICYFNSLEDGFCFDDKAAIVRNDDLRPATPVYKLFLNDFWGKPLHKVIILFCITKLYCILQVACA